MTQLQLTRRLARAFKRRDALRTKLAEAEHALSEEFSAWSAGRRVNRDEARKQLVSTGYLEKGKV